MAEENVGYIRIARPGLPEQEAAVLHRGKPAAVEVALNAVLPHRLAVPHVILPHHQKAQAVEVLGKGVIPCNIFRNAVDDLHHSFHFPIGRPDTAVDGTGACGRVGKVAAHGLHHLVARSHDGL